MAKAGSRTAAKGGGAASGSMKNFEERLERLETLGERIRRTDIPLDEALNAFEEGIRLARTLEKDLEKIDSRVEILMNGTDAPCEESGEEESSPELELFETED